MKRTAILGLGLMGASLGLALKKRKYADGVAGYARREEVRRNALARNVVDEVFAEPGPAVSGADVVVLSVPIYAMRPLLQSCKPMLAETALVTDVGSTKAVLMDDLTELLSDHSAVFVGSHPVAGSERQGLDAARDDLYEKALVVLTPPGHGVTEPVQRTRRLWESVGAVPRIMSAPDHDRMLARTSHLPHLAASSLVAAIGRGDALEEMAPFCGTGFRDTTRVADGAPYVWYDIVKSNQTAILGELKAYRDEVEHLISIVKSRDLKGMKDFLETSRRTRNALLNPAQPRPS